MPSARHSHTHDPTQAFALAHHDQDVPADYLAAIAPVQKERAAKDWHARQQATAQATDVQMRIEELKNKLYLARYHTGHDNTEIIHQVRQLLEELNRLLDVQNRQRAAALSEFTDSLHLDQLGIARRIPQRSVSTTAHIAFDADADESSSTPLMRTKSAAQEAPQESGFMSLLRTLSNSWTTPATQPPATRTTNIDKEIDQLRAEIYALRQKKELSEAERQRFAAASAKLRALNKLPRTPSAH